MGIKNLNTILRDKAPCVYKPTHLSEFAYKKIAIDITLFLCKFKTTAGDDWIQLFVNLVCCLRSNDIHCVFIYDNVAPVEKTAEREERVRNREKTQQRFEHLKASFERYKKEGIIEDTLKSFCDKLQKDDEAKFNPELVEAKLNRMKNYNFKITSDDFALTRELFDILKVPYYLAPSEAECTCSDLCKRGLVDGVLSEDTDVLAYGAPLFLTKIDFYNSICVKIEHHEVLQELDLCYEEFLDMCIMLGCDYNKNIPKIGCETSFKLIKQYRNIDNIITAKPELDASVLNHIRVREMFKEYKQLEIKDNKIPYCGQPDIELFKEFITRNEIRSVNMDKLLKAIAMRPLVFKDSYVDEEIEKEEDDDIEDEEIEKEEEEIKEEPIYFFNDDEPFYEFSNFYKCSFILDNETWMSTEHYFQANKFVNHPEYMSLIRDTNTPYKAFILANQKKKAGYASNWTVNTRNKTLINDIIEQYKDSVFIREDWDDVKLSIMKDAVHAKFTQNKSLKDILLSTGERDLIEASPSDYYWGIGKNKTGENHLGKILVNLRTELRNEML